MHSDIALFPRYLSRRGRRSLVAFLALAAVAVWGPTEARAQTNSEIETLRRAAAAATADSANQPGQAGTLGQARANLFNPRITLFGDFVGRTHLTRGDLTETDSSTTPPTVIDLDDRFNLREVELDARADVDPYTKAVVIVAWGSEEPAEFGGEALVEEGYVLFDALPWNLKLQAGRFLSQFGAINRTHIHDLPWTTLPTPITTYMGEEGYGEQGAALDSLWGRVAGGVLRHRLEVTNGETHPLLAGADSDNPAYVNRLAWFRDTGPSSYLELGGSHLFGHNDLAGKQESHLLGADLLWKWKHPSFGSFRSLVLQGEYFQASKEDPAGDMDARGWYAFAQYQLDKRWYAGLRYDQAEQPDGTKARETVSAAYLSYYTTEFCRLRLGYERHDRKDLGEKDLEALVFQLTFVFGAHPAEPYWVNR